MKIHKKKINPQWFELRIKGLKDWEIRVNDCDYQDGDYLVLNEWIKEHYTGRQMIVKITHVTRGIPYMSNSIVVLSTRNVGLLKRLMVYRELRKQKNGS